MHLVPAPGWDAPGTRLPSTDIHQRGEPRLTGKLHLLMCFKAESRWGKGIMQLQSRVRLTDPRNVVGVLTRQGTGLCPRCFRKDHGSPRTGMWDQACETEVSRLGRRGCSAALGAAWALEFLLSPKDCSLSQQKGMFHQKGRLSLLLSLVFQSGPERPGQELGVWLSG